jgi:hypothetical protein
MEKKIMDKNIGLLEILGIPLMEKMGISESKDKILLNVV